MSMSVSGEEAAGESNRLYEGCIVVTSFHIIIHINLVNDLFFFKFSNTELSYESPWNSKNQRLKFIRKNKNLLFRILGRFI